jgi:hypothetical protein
VQAYGIGPPLSALSGGGAHADDERIAVRSLMKQTEFLWNVVLEIAASR